MDDLLKTYYKIMMKRLKIFSLILFLVLIFGLILYLPILFKTFETHLILNIFFIVFLFIVMSIFSWLTMYIGNIEIRFTSEQNLDNDEKLDKNIFSSIFALYLNKKNYKNIFENKNNKFIEFCKGLLFFQKSNSKKLWIKKANNIIISIIWIVTLILALVLDFLVIILSVISLVPSLFLIYILVKLFSWDINKKIKRELER